MQTNGMVIALCVLSGCSGGNGKQFSADSVTPLLQAAGQPSEKLNATYIHDRVVADVISNGCTRVDQFSVVSQLQENACVLTVVRDSPDLCKRASFVHRVEIPAVLNEQCRAQEIKFVNPSLSDD